MASTLALTLAAPAIVVGVPVMFKIAEAQTKAELIQELLEDNEGFMFVDDHPDNCINVHENFPDAEVWLMSRAHNQDFKHSVIRRALHWDDIMKHPREV